MSTPVAELYETARASLTAAGFSAALVQRRSDTVIVAAVPKARRTWAEFALLSFTSLPLADADGQARFALFTAPEDNEPYSRQVYFRATGPGLSPKYVDKELTQSVRIVPGYSTEADVPKILAAALFGTSERADDITVTRIA